MSGAHGKWAVGGSDVEGLPPRHGKGALAHARSARGPATPSAASQAGAAAADVAQGAPEHVSESLRRVGACLPLAAAATTHRGAVAVHVTVDPAVPTSLSDACAAGAAYGTLVDDAVAAQVCALAGRGVPAPAVDAGARVEASAMVAFFVTPPPPTGGRPAWKIWATVAGAGGAALAALALGLPLLLRASRRATARIAHRRYSGSLSGDSSSSTGPSGASRSVERGPSRGTERDAAEATFAGGTDGAPIALDSESARSRSSHSSRVSSHSRSGSSRRSSGALDATLSESSSSRRSGSRSSSSWRTRSSGTEGSSG